MRKISGLISKITVFIGMYFLICIPVLGADSKISEYQVHGSDVAMYVVGVDMLPETYSYQIGNSPCDIDEMMLLPDSSQSLHTVLLWDNSLSVSGKNGDIVRSLLTDIIANRVEGEFFTLAKIDRQVTYLIEESNDYATIKDIIDNTAAENKDAFLIENLYDVIETVNSFDTDEFFRIIAVSDGIDTTMSGVSISELNSLLQKTPYPIYMINAGGTSSEHLKNMSSISRTTNAEFYSITGDEAVSNDVIISRLRADANILKVVVKVPNDMRDGSTKNTRLTINDNNYDCELTMPFDIKEEVIEEPGEIIEEEIEEEPEEEEFHALEVPDNEKGKLPVKLIIIAAAAFICVILIVVIIVVVVNINKSKKRNEERRKAEEMGRLGQGISNPYSQRENAMRTVMMDDEQQQQQGGNHTVLLFDNNNSSITLRNIMSPSEMYSSDLSGLITIGRGTSNKIVISNDNAVSEKHCEIYMTDGSVYIRDAGSSNGTKVGDMRISAPVRLSNGDIITLGFRQYEVIIN